MVCSCEEKMNAATQQDLHNEHQSFFDILENQNLTALMQPIVDLNHRNIHGYESLIRGPSDSPYHNPIMLFDIAIRSGKLLELDLLCRDIGINSFQEQRLSGKLFLNATPISLLEPKHRSGLTLEILERAGIHPKNVVIEMTEQYPMDNFSAMRSAIEHYKSMGFEIAIDDLGTGYSGLQRWSELRPDYVKIDRHFIQGIHEDKTKQSFVRSINDIARGLDCKVIAEGIETQDEYRTVFNMGIKLGQGYYFARPKQVPPYSIPSELFSYPSKDKSENSTRTSKNISGLIIKVPDISPNTTLENVHALFHKLTDLTSLPILEKNGKPLGLIRRNQLLSTLSTKYGRALYGSKSVMDFIDRTTVIADKEWSIEKVSQLVIKNMKMNIEDDFIITENGQYVGLGKVIKLLEKITDLQIENARYANPLTLLPGNVPIYERIDELLGSNSTFCIAYCDIDSFKPFNDVYGYAKGDKIIKKVADILLQEVDSEDDFVGHVGGDDFIIIFKSKDWHERCDAILNNFEETITKYYNKLDIKNKGIRASSRNGEDTFYPLMTLSIGALTPKPAHYVTYADIAELATQAKHNAKKILGNSLFIERRS